MRETRKIERNKTAIVLFVTVLVFFICQIPHCLVTIFEFIYPIRSHHLFCYKKGRQKVFFMKSISMIYFLFSITYRHNIPVIWFLLNGIEATFLALNSSVNFIIYYATGKYFRDEFIKIFGPYFYYIFNQLSSIFVSTFTKQDLFTRLAFCSDLLTN